MNADEAPNSGVAGFKFHAGEPVRDGGCSRGTRFLINSFLVVILGKQGSVQGVIIAAIVLGGTLGTLQFQISTVYAQIATLLVAILATRLRPVVSERVAGLRAAA